jgi:EAL domain-containing protein (putative c-di-GMP-specific phosphodiesterase class I)
MRGVNALIDSLAARRHALHQERSTRDPSPPSRHGAGEDRPGEPATAPAPAAADSPSTLELVDMLAARRFGVEYQPIVHVDGLAPHGWEALARFRDARGVAVPPDRVFARLHDSPVALLYAERELKREQIRHAPPRGRLFLNLDPDSWHAGGADAFLPLLAQARQDGVVVEIIENMSLRDVALSARMARELEQARIPVALDDVGADGALFSYSALDGAAYMKLDRFWLAGSPGERARKAPMARGLIATAEQFGLKVVVEGVETPDDLEAARALGAHFVQGWLFAADFIQRWPEPDGFAPMPQEPTPGVHQGTHPGAHPFTTALTSNRASEKN